MANEWGTAGLVPGLKLRLTSNELADHLRARAAYHRQRRDDKRAELPKIREAVESLKAHSAAPAVVVSNFNKGGAYGFDGDTAVESLERDIAEHNNKSVAFDFLAEHLFEQDYCLDRDDLVRLEILK